MPGYVNQQRLIDAWHDAVSSYATHVAELGKLAGKSHPDFLTVLHQADQARIQADKAREDLKKREGGDC